MAVRSSAAPPTPWSKTLAEPQIDPSAYVHASSYILGDVRVGANVLVAPRTSIRADEGTPFSIGRGTSIQDGVVIHGLDRGRVVGDDGKEYSVWIGVESCITHLAIVHGPAYIGDKTFIGFRSTIFNARVGEGCIVMMHALVQDVEIPPQRFVPSGAIVTNQQQADRLPVVQDSDRAFVDHLIEVNEALRAGYQCAEDDACILPIRNQLRTQNGYSQPQETMLATETTQQVRALLQQGYHIGIERADARRFKTKSWLTAGTLATQREAEALREIASKLSEYEGEYVRLVGIDPQQKRRVSETVIQRPGDTAPPTNGRASYTPAASRPTPVPADSSTSTNGDLASQVRSLLEQGLSIGVEHATARRFKTKSWQTAPAIASRNQGEVLRQLAQILRDCEGEYVRLIGVDDQHKQRVSETIIQRPGEAANTSSPSDSYYRSYSTGSNGHSHSPSTATTTATSLSPEVISLVRSLLAQGCKIGSEHADPRRFRTKSWQTCPPSQSDRESAVLAQLEACCAEHPGEYVRIFGIDSKVKRRISETIIQRPGEQTPVVRASSIVAEPPHYNNLSSPTSGSRSSLGAELLSQVRAWLSQGYKIGTEHADRRHFRAKSWQTCSPIASTRESEVLAALEGCCSEHQGEYVRAFGIDTQGKRRVSETIIQRP